MAQLVLKAYRSYLICRIPFVCRQTETKITKLSSIILDNWICSYIYLPISSTCSYGTKCFRSSYACFYSATTTASGTSTCAPSTNFRRGHETSIFLYIFLGKLTVFDCSFIASRYKKCFLTSILKWSSLCLKPTVEIKIQQLIRYYKWLISNLWFDALYVNVEKDLFTKNLLFFYVRIIVLKMIL